MVRAAGIGCILTLLLILAQRNDVHFNSDVMISAGHLEVRSMHLTWPQEGLQEPCLWSSSA